MKTHINQNWTIEDNEKIKRLWDSGFQVGHIAQEFKKSKKAVYSKILRLGLGKRHKPANKPAKK